LDLLTVVDEFPSDEGVQRAQSALLQGGGPVATALVALARLGSRTAMVDRLGNDWRGEAILAEFRREEVDTDHIVVDAGCSSSIAVVLVRRRDGARSIVYAPGDAPDLESDRLPFGLLSQAKILHLNGRHPDACCRLAAAAKGNGTLVSFDGGAHRFTEQTGQVVGLSDICIVARQFAFAYADTDAMEVAAEKLLSAGPAVVAITGGTQGSWVFSRSGDPFHQPAFNIDDTVDTTGAGDAYHGAFLHGIAHGYSLRDCAVLASAVAAINTQALGGRAALPTHAAAKAFLSRRGLYLAHSA
jgi:sugar/nucleoside kinase (ribokinase family)